MYKISNNSDGILWLIFSVVVINFIFSKGFKEHIIEYNQNSNIFFKFIFGNSFQWKFVLTLIASSLIFKHLRENCSKTYDNNTVFSKTILFTTGIIFFQLVIYILNYHIGTKFKKFHLSLFEYIINLIISLLFIYMFYELEMKCDKENNNIKCMGCENNTDAETAGISILFIVFCIFLGICIKELGQIINNIPYISIFTFWKNYDINYKSDSCIICNYNCK